MTYMLLYFVQNADGDAYDMTTGECVLKRKCQMRFDRKRKYLGNVNENEKEHL